MSLDFAEKIIGITKILGIIIFVISPFLIHYFLMKFRKIFGKSIVIPFFILNLMSLSGIALVFIYWSAELAPKLLLYHFGFEYGYDFGASFEKVLPENRARLQQIYNSLFGIGWSLKCILVWFLFVLPYGLISVFGKNLVKK